MVQYVIPGAAGSAEHNASLGSRERNAYARPHAVVHASAPGALGHDQCELKRLLLRSGRQIETPTMALSDAQVVHWLCRAMCAGKGEGYLMTARQERAQLRLNPDPNLVAAERFMGGYEGTINEVALGFQFVGKHWRETWLAEKVRQAVPASAWNNMLFTMFFGKNGSPASSVSFTTRWGLSGIGHRYMKIKPGSEQSPFQCNCLDVQ